MTSSNFCCTFFKAHDMAANFLPRAISAVRYPKNAESIVHVEIQKVRYTTLNRFSVRNTLLYVLGKEGEGFVFLMFTEQ